MTIKKKNILIIGAYGLLGCVLSDFLLKKGYKVFRAGTQKKI